MNEKDLLGMKFGDCKGDNCGNWYTRTIGGWVYSNFSGRVCFIPEPSVIKENLTTEKADKKAKEK